MCVEKQAYVSLARNGQLLLSDPIHNVISVYDHEVRGGRHCLSRGGARIEPRGWGGAGWFSCKFHDVRRFVCV